MSGRHRRQRARTGIGVRRVLTGVVPVLAAAGVAAAVVLGGGALGGEDSGSRDIAALAAPPAGASPASVVAAATPSVLRTLPGAGAATETARDAVLAASARAEKDREEASAREDTAHENTASEDTGDEGGVDEDAATGSGAGVCDLEGPPRFDDPAHPNWITNRDCGYVDEQGRERSQDPWIDGQLLSSYGE